MRILFLALLLFPLLVFATSSDIYTFNDTKKADQFNNLTKEIRCVVCQNQNIGDSNAPLANDLRAKIYVMVNNDQSDEQIKDFLVKRYGQFILLRPSFNKTNMILWFFPLIALGFASLFILKTARTKKRGNQV